MNDNIIEIKEKEFNGYHIKRNNDGWQIEENCEQFKTCQDAEKYITNGMKRTSAR